MYALSMVVPRKLLDSVGHRLPKEQAPLVDVPSSSLPP